MSCRKTHANNVLGHSLIGGKASCSSWWGAEHIYHLARGCTTQRLLRLDLKIVPVTESLDFMWYGWNQSDPTEQSVQLQFTCIWIFAWQIWAAPLTVSLAVTEGQVTKDSASSFNPSCFLTMCSNPSILSCWFTPENLYLQCLNSEQGQLGVRADAQIVLSALAKYGFSSWSFPCPEVQDFLSSLAWMDGKNNSLKINSSQEMWRPGKSLLQCWV